MEHLTPDENRAMSLAVGRILRHAYDAKVELETGEREMAIEEVAKAKKLVNMIEAAVPDTERTYRITVGDETYEDTEIAAAEIIPIFTELDRVSLMAPLHDAKAGKNRKDGSNGEPEMVVDESLDFAKISLDLNTARSGLNKADAALADGKSEAAKTALLNVLSSVRFSLVLVELPLERAQDNLMLAKSELEHGNKTTARELLNLAADEIDNYSHHGSKAGVASREKLRDEIKAATNKIDDKHATVAAKTEDWWDRIGAWMRR